MKILIIKLIIFAGIAALSCQGGNKGITEPIETISKITMIELGASYCEPCKKMQPIMASLQERYGEEQLDVQFIDVQKEWEKAQPFKIRVMPTQVFLDDEGEEFHRHEGFYPEEEIDSLLQANGLKPIE